MNDDRYNQLIEKLNTFLSVDKGPLSVSPTRGTPGASKAASPGTPFIVRKMDINVLSQNETLLVHTLLHKFYASGNRDLSKTDIRNLHNEVKEKLASHVYFDRLDDS